MTMSSGYRLVLAFLLLPLGLSAQNDPAAKEFFNGISECATSLGGWKCLELDLSSEIIEENDTTKVYEYSWNFGDGTRKQGTKTEHCYAEFGEYQISLDLIDKETATVIRSELSSTAFLYPEIFPVISISTENVPPSFMQFSCSFGAHDFTPDHIYWRINGEYYEGPLITYAFPVAGEYLIEVAVEKDMEFLGIASACASRKLKVSETNVWTTGVMKSIEAAREQAGLGPFASADVVCQIRTSGNGSDESHMFPLSTLMGQVKLETGKIYEISLFAGSLFSGKKLLDTNGVTGNDLYMRLRDIVVSLADEPLIALQPLHVKMEKILSLSDDPEFKKTAAQLGDYSHLHIEVGSYVHTGSRLSHGISQSVAMASTVREALVKFGIASERVTVASPEYNQALINTCSATPDCGLENADLNGRVEFKITGTKL